MDTSAATEPASDTQTEPEAIQSVVNNPVTIDSHPASPAPDEQPVSLETVATEVAASDPDIDSANNDVPKISKLIDTLAEDATRKNTDIESQSNSQTASRDNSNDAKRNESVQKQTTNTRGTAGRTKALEHRRIRREEHLRTILEYAKRESSIRNDDIAKLLRVSDKTATRYASALVLRGLLFRSGKGRSVIYTPAAA